MTDPPTLLALRQVLEIAQARRNDPEFSGCVKTELGWCNVVARALMHLGVEVSLVEVKAYMLMDKLNDRMAQKYLFPVLRLSDPESAGGVLFVDAKGRIGLEAIARSISYENDWNYLPCNNLPKVMGEP